MAIGVILAAAGAAACGHGSSTSPSDATPLVLKNVGVAIDAYDPGTSLAGDVFLQPWVPKAFGEFGQPTQDQNGNRKALPTYDFVIPDNVAIVSAISGVVTKIFNQGGDYEVLIAPNKNSAWFVSLDHVSRPQVAEGQSVSAGQAIAYGSPYPDTFVWAGKHLAFFEFMIANQQSSQAACPIDYLDASLKDL
jgi:murein DD-endopeptidase MepM/ murein hydrolase activator NlpD